MDIYVNPATTITVRKGDGGQDHNIRKYIASNVDQDRVKDNIVFVNEPIVDAYRNNFDESIRHYNIGKKPSRQKWPDMEHPADGYLQKLQKDIAECADEKKRKKLPRPFYEVIIQIGNMEDYGVLTHPQRAQIAKEILTIYMSDFQKNNPRLYVFCAVLHMDEATPHIHIDYFPVARNLPTGLPVRNALTQALAQQGIQSGNNKNDNNNSVWQVKQIDLLKELCEEHGIQTKIIGAEKRKNLTPDEYRILMAKNEQKLDRTREETNNSIKCTAFGKAFVDVEKIREERAITDVLREQYHEKLQEMALEKAELHAHYKDAEADLKAEAKTKIENLDIARQNIENVDRQMKANVLIAQAEQKMKEAESIARNAQKEAKAQVYKDMERKIKEAESRGRRLGKMDVQNEIAQLQSRAISAEKSRDNVKKKTKNMKMKSVV